MANACWPEFGLADLSEPSITSTARAFIKEWARVDGSDVANYRQQVARLLDEFLSRSSRIAPLLDQIVHGALTHKNLSAEIDAWQRALCSNLRGVEAVRSDAGQCERAITDWCAKAVHQGHLVDEAFELQPETDWDRWLCSTQGFYGHSEFLAGVELGTIGQWSLLENLRTAVHSACSDGEAATVLERAKSAVYPEHSSTIDLRL
jgi:hypothetical protein